MKNCLLTLTAILSLLTIARPAAQAQTFSQIIKAVASDRASDDEFGYSVAISGDYAIVGAIREDEDASGSNTLSGAGAAYIFKKDAGGTDNWNQIKKIVASDRAAGDIFGFSVAISGDYAIVGAFEEDEDASGSNTVSNAGSAYIFKKDEGGTDNWGEIKKIVASDRAVDNQFGYSVAISGDYAIVGARHNGTDANGGNVISESGAAYIFKKDEGGTDNWGEVQKIVASDRADDVIGGVFVVFGQRFGNSVAISGDYAIVGARLNALDANASNRISDAGAAYIFKKDEGGTDNWGELQKIVASDRADSDRFGWSVAISGDYAIVGAVEEDEDANGSNTFSSAGSAYIFKKDQGGTDNWGEVKKIVASDRAASDQFGLSVSISGDYAIVGSELEDEDANGGNTASKAGSAYIFKKDEGGTDNWGQTQKIVASDRASEDALGISVAISGDYVIVGAYLEDEDASGSNTASKAGSAYIFKNGAVLPVELTYFKGQPTQAGSLLSWQTASEQNNEGFEIEKSINGQDWENIGFVAGNGTTTNISNYEFTDQQPEIGTNYYRLKQIDFDGQFEYSAIVNIKYQTAPIEIKIFPNPVADYLTVESEAAIGSHIQLFDTKGQLIKEWKHQSTISQIATDQLTNGIYFLKMNNQTQQIIIQK